MKVLIVEDALSGLNGHWFQYIYDIVREGTKAGYEIEVAVPKEAAPEVLSRLPARAILSTSLSSRKSKSLSFIGSLIRILSTNLSLYQDLKQFFQAGHSYDLIISTSTRVDHLFAYVLLFRKFQYVKIIRMGLIFIDTVATYSGDFSKISFSKKHVPLKYAIKLAAFLSVGDQLQLLAESEGVARQYEELSGVIFGVVPHVTVLPSLDDYREDLQSPLSNKAKAIVLATYGFTRYDKGLDVLQDALRMHPHFTKSTNLLFVLQWTGDYQMTDGSWIRKDPILEKSPQVYYLPPFIESEEYYRWIAQTNVMVLPYRRGFYKDRLSRVAIDAALAGIPIIYPRGTWLEDFVTDYAAGVPFEGDNPKSLALAIEFSVSKLHELKDLAVTRQVKTAAFFSAKSFFHEIGIMTDCDS